MGRYIGAGDFFLRYNQATDYSSAAVESHFIYYAENELDSLLTNYFTVPFSSDNVTAKDLSIELTYIRSGDLKFEDAEKRRARLMKFIEQLKSGEAGMVVTSGTLLSVGDTIYSSTSTYHRTFGMGDIEDYLVDSSQIYDEYQDRHL